MAAMRNTGEADPCDRRVDQAPAKAAPSVSDAHSAENGQFDDLATFEAPRSVGERLLSALLTPRMWGFAFSRAWVYLLFLGVGSGILAFTNGLADGVYVWSCLFLCVTLFAGAIASRFMERAIFTAAVRYLAVVLIAAGTLCVVLLVTTTLPAFAVAAVAGMTTGLGSGLLNLGYGEIYRNAPPSDTGVEIPLAALVAAAIFAVVSLAQGVWGLIFAAILALAAGLIMARYPHTWAKAQAWKANQAAAPTMKLVVRISACACGVGLADGINRQVFMVAAGISSHDFYHPAMLVSSVVVAILLVTFVFVRADRAFQDLYRLISFVIAASIAMAPALVISRYAPMGSLVTLVGYNAFNVFVWMLLADLSYNYRLSAAAVFGTGWGMLTVGNTAGQILGMQISRTMVLTPQAISFVSGLATLVVFAVCLFVLKGDDLVGAKERHALVESVGKALPDDVIAQVDANADEDLHARFGAQGDSSDVALRGECDADSSQWTAAGDTSACDVNQRRRVPFREACTQLAQDKGLTPRETEILILSAQGRSAARIQEELFISRGTVTTHLQHIYRKLDIHSKQEMIDLIEEHRG